MQVDSLIISLGLDPQELRQGLAQVEALLNQFAQRINAFANDFQQGFSEAASAVGQASGAATQQAAEAGEAAQEAGQKFEEAGQRGGKGMQNLADKTRQATAAARQTGGEMQSLGRKWGSFLGGMAARFAAPLAGALSAGAIVGGYMRDVSQVAQMTGRYSTQMEEWQKKRELLSRVTREDVELYRKGKLALLDFNFAMAGLSTTVMRALSPAIQGGIKILHSLSDWVRRNEPNIIRFVTVLAGTITAVLIPSFVKLGAAMLMNPLTWIIAGILLLALVVDSLVTYIRGGESALRDFWAIFGTGEEISDALAAAWDYLKVVGSDLWDGLTAAARTFFGYFDGAFAALRQMFLGFVGFVKALFSGNFKEAGQELRNVFSGALDYIKEIYLAWFNVLRDAIRGLLDMLPSWEGFKSGAGSLWDGVKDFGTGLFGGGEQANDSTSNPYPSTSAGGSVPVSPFPDVIPTNAQLTAAAIPASLTTDNTRNTTIQSDTTIQNMTIQTPATDADGILRDARSAADRRFAGLGVMAAEGGVRQ